MGELAYFDYGRIKDFKHYEIGLFFWWFIDWFSTPSLVRCRNKGLHRMTWGGSIRKNQSSKLSRILFDNGNRKIRLGR